MYGKYLSTELIKQTIAAIIASIEVTVLNMLFVGGGALKKQK